MTPINVFLGVNTPPSDLDLALHIKLCYLNCTALILVTKDKSNESYTNVHRSNRILKPRIVSNNIFRYCKNKSMMSIIVRSALNIDKDTPIKVYGIDKLIISELEDTPFIFK